MSKSKLEEIVAKHFPCDCDWRTYTEALKKQVAHGSRCRAYRTEEALAAAREYAEALLQHLRVNGDLDFEGDLRDAIAALGPRIDQAKGGRER